MTRRSFATSLVQRMPPWLRRTVGGALVRGLGDPLDAVASLTREAAAARFPTADRPDALPVIGAERRIIRGPGEPAATYAGRLRLWLDSHRTRGGAYALLEQLFAFWRYSLNVPIDVVAYSGGRESMDTSGAITRDIIDWTGDSSGSWAQDWIFFHCPSAIDVAIVADTGEEIVASTGDTIIASIDLAALGGVLPAELVDEFKLVPSTWRPAHLKRCTIVLLFSGNGLWDYEPPLPTWDEWSAGGELWGDEPTPIQIVIDF